MRDAKVVYERGMKNAKKLYYERVPDSRRVEQIRATHRRYRNTQFRQRHWRAHQNQWLSYRRETALQGGSVLAKSRRYYAGLSSTTVT